MLEQIKNKRNIASLAVLLIVIIFIFSIGYVVEYSNLTNDSAEPGEKKEDSSADPEEEEEICPEEERKEREEALRDELGNLFVPLPPAEGETNPAVKARGIYLTGHSVGLKSRYDNILNLVDSTELNSLVIDVKDDHGRLTYHSGIEYVDEIDSEYSNVPIKDMEGVLNDLHRRDIYPIARIVVFRDPYLAEKKNDLAIQKADGSGVWRNSKGVSWVNPYKKEVWDYNIAIAKEAALLGFREIQFDYVRFPEGARFIENSVYYPGHNDIAKDDIIAEFLQYAGEQLKEYNVHLAADVFGVIATSWGDSDMIGQTWEKMAPHVDYNCPMIYPSHYGPGYFGLSVPDANPEATIKRALEDSLKRNAQVENPGIIRPWLQAFTATWINGHIPYGAREVRLQIDAALELGIDEYMIWNAGNVYPEEAFLDDEEAERRIREIREKREEKGHDYLGRTAEEALSVYFSALNRNDWREAYAIAGTGFNTDPEEFKNKVHNSSAKISDFSINAGEREDDKVSVTVDLEIRAKGEKIYLEEEQWQVVMENNVWKIVSSDAFSGIVFAAGE